MRTVQLELAGRGPGFMSALDFGPRERPIELVFLHANGFNALTYRAILAPLVRERRILAVDQRGHGASTLATEVAGRRDWLDLRDDLLALLEALDLSDVVLAGHSMGGTVSILANAPAAGRARELVLFDPVIMSGQPPLGRGEGDRSGMVEAARRRRTLFPDRAAAMDAYRGRGAFRTWPADMLADFVNGGFVEDSGGGVRLACSPAWEASGYAAQDHDVLGALARSIRPTRILKAEIDSTCRIEAAPQWPLVEIEVVAGASHFLPMERPELATAALADALSSR